MKRLMWLMTGVIALVSAAAAPAMAQEHYLTSCQTCGDATEGCMECNACDPCADACDPCATRCGVLASSGIEVGGWIQFGMYGNGWGAPDNGPLGMNDAVGASLHQSWAYLGKEADGSCGLDWGGRCDFVWGTDGPDTQCFGDGGWDFGWNSGGGYGAAIPQLYAEVALGALRVKGGHFYTLIGYEVVQAPDNFFFSHSYTMYYAEPFTHTGALAELSILDDTITLYGGWVDGWDSGFGNENGASTILTGVSVQLMDDISIMWAASIGNNGTAAATNLTQNDIYMQSVVVDVTLTERLNYVFQSDLGISEPIPGTKNEWYGINQYFLYEINECLAAGLRAEWFHDDDGTRVVTGTYNGNPGNYYGFTAGLNIKPCKSLIIRPEVRYDSFDALAGATAQRPFNSERSATQISGGFDMIWTF